MNTQKIIQALTYFAFKQKDHIIDCLKAYKMLWLADRCQLRYSGRLLSGDTYYAMPFGPVPSDAKHIIDGQATILPHEVGYANTYITSLDKKYKANTAPDMNVFSISDIDILNKVFDKFNDMTYTELSAYSHRFPEWKHYEERLKDSNDVNSIKIDVDYFFEDAEESQVDDFFKDDNEILKLSKEMYHLQNRC